MTLELVLQALFVVLLVLPLVAVYSNVQLWRLWLSDDRRPRSWVLFSMAAASTATNVASFPVAWLVTVRMMHIRVETVLALLLLTVSIVVIETTPVFFWIVVRRRKISGPTHDGDDEPDPPPPL